MLHTQWDMIHTQTRIATPAHLLVTMGNKLGEGGVPIIWLEVAQVEGSSFT